MKIDFQIPYVFKFTAPCYPTITNIMRNGGRHNEHKLTVLLACRLHSPKLTNKLTLSPAQNLSFCLR